MSNPNWPSFPGLQNLTQDGDGRPQVLDLIPGRQRGTPLNSLLFNPLIRAVCDLRDTADDQSAALRDYLPLVGGTLSGPLTVQAPAGSGNTLFGGGLVSSVAGQTANAYLQLQIVNGVPTAVIGIQDSNGWHNFTLSADGSLANPEGQKFALQSAVDQERQRAQEAEAGLQPAGDYATKDALQQEIKRAQEAEAKLQPAGDYAKSEALQGYLPLAGGTLSGPLTVQVPAGSGNTLFGGGLVSSVAGQTANAYLQLQIVNGQPLAIVGIQDSNGWHNWTFNPAASSLTNPVGNSIPEVVGPTGRVAIQSFTLSFQPIPRTGSQVPVYSIRWPQPFRSTPQVFFQIDFENGTSMPSPRTVNIAAGNGTTNNNVDIYGARINITYTGWSNSVVDTTNAPISSLNVIAIGEM